jgi:hypothetical protein
MKPWISPSVSSGSKLPCRKQFGQYEFTVIDVYMHIITVEIQCLLFVTTEVI